jgi:hypothetical protein
MTMEKPSSSFQSDAGDFEQYRSVSKAGVISVLLGGMGILGLMFPVMLALPMVGAIFGFQSIRTLCRYPAEMTGWIPAIFGTVLSVIFSGGGVGLHTYIYLTEVPDGFERITFSQLQPQLRSQRIPPDANELDRRKVFIKGYMHPSGTQGLGDVSQFVLVPDMGTCCFGGQPKLTDMVEVTLTDGLSTRYTRYKKKLAGVFSVDSELKPVNGLNGVYYELDASYVR